MIKWTDRWKALRGEKQLIGNFVALGLVQGTNVLIPLFTFPYLIRTIGTEKFGIISYGLTVMVYLIVFTDFGFNTTATRQVALARDEPAKLSSIFSAVLVTKLLLFGVGSGIVLLLTLVVERFRGEAFTYLIGLTYALGTVLFPSWFFQGVERMKHITFVNLASKLLLLLFLLTFINDKADYPYVIGLYGLANVLSGVYSIYVAISRYALSVRLPRRADILALLREGWPVFVVSLSNMGLNNLNILILGFYVTNAALGQYSMAEKVITSIWQILIIFSQVIYPRMCRLMLVSHSAVRSFVLTVCPPFCGAVFLLSVGLYVGASDLIQLIAGQPNPQAAYLLQEMSFVPFIVSLNVPVYQILLAYNQSRQSAGIFVGAALINLLIAPLFIGWMGLSGAVYSLVLIQTLVTLCLYAALETRFSSLSLFRSPLSKPVDSELNAVEK